MGSGYENLPRKFEMSCRGKLWSRALWENARMRAWLMSPSLVLWKRCVRHVWRARAAQLKLPILNRSLWLVKPWCRPLPQPRCDPTVFVRVLDSQFWPSEVRVYLTWEQSQPLFQKMEKNGCVRLHRCKLPRDSGGPTSTSVRSTKALPSPARPVSTLH